MRRGGRPNGLILAVPQGSDMVSAKCAETSVIWDSYMEVPFGNTYPYSGEGNPNGGLRRCPGRVERRADPKINRAARSDLQDTLGDLAVAGSEGV